MTVPVVPSDFIQAIAAFSQNPYLAPLLWKRGYRDLDKLSGFLQADQYQPTDAWAFGEDMTRSIDRIEQAIVDQEFIALWPALTPDGMTATALLSEGLSALRVSHSKNPVDAKTEAKIHIVQPKNECPLQGFSIAELDELKHKGIHLVIACGVSSDHFDELDYAKTIGLALIMIHSDPCDDRDDRIKVYAQLNSQHFPPNHPLHRLPSVAIAYKLMEALYARSSGVISDLLKNLLDFVAIGLLSGWVDFVGDTRFLFQMSIPRLQAQLDPKTSTRPGLSKLLKLCRDRGDRVMDFNSGLGARIRALSQVQPHACLALLTSRDRVQAEALAHQAELSHIRLLALQQEVLDQALQMLRVRDLSMEDAIILVNPQWSFSALPSVVEDLKNRLNKTVFLLSSEHQDMIYGFGRSDFNLDQIIQPIRHLLHRSQGHPHALSLSLPQENLEIFTQALQQQLRLAMLQSTPEAIHSESIDLTVTVADLGETLFKALRSIEPCGLSNPLPRLRLNHVWFEAVKIQKMTDSRYQPVIYRCTQFRMIDQTGSAIQGRWWGHGPEDFPKGPCNAIVQLENNVKQKRYEVRLLNWSPITEQRADRNDMQINVPINVRNNVPINFQNDVQNDVRIVDRSHGLENDLICANFMDMPLIPIIDHRDHPERFPEDQGILIQHCPRDWTILQQAYRRSVLTQQSLILAYHRPTGGDWTTLLGIAKYLARTGTWISVQQWCDRLAVSLATLQAGLTILCDLGFQIQIQGEGLTVSREAIDAPSSDCLATAARQWTGFLREERFRQQYFMQVSLAVLQAFLHESLSRSETVDAAEDASMGK